MSGISHESMPHTLGTDAAEPSPPLEAMQIDHEHFIIPNALLSRLRPAVHFLQCFASACRSRIVSLLCVPLHKPTPFVV